MRFFLIYAVFRSIMMQRHTIFERSHTMKKILGLALVGLVLVCGMGSAQAGSLPVKLSIIPTVGLPLGETVHGLDIGLIGTKIDEVKGLQGAWIFAGTKQKMVGLQGAFVSINSNEMTGIQYSLYNKSANLTGLQLGCINSGENMTGIQFGFVNIANKAHGLQLGLVNIIKEGRLPFMV